MKLKVKISTIARIGALVVVIVNEFLALFGKEALPFTDSFVYQIISLVLTAIVSAINCWFNQDISVAARLSGKVFDALKDGKLTEEEISQIIADVEEAENSGYTDDSFLVNFANSIIKNIQSKNDNSGDAPKT